MTHTVYQTLHTTNLICGPFNGMKALCGGKALSTAGLGAPQGAQRDQ